MKKHAAIEIIYEECKDSDIKSVCVFNQIDFKYDDYRANDLKASLFLSPDVMMNNGGYGVCRDIAIYRHAVLTRLGIFAEFIFEPGHVYILSRENNRTYEMNNQILIITR